MWIRYRVTWNFLTDLCGSVPSDPEVVKAWTDARRPNKRPPESRSLDQINEEVLTSIERGEDFDEASCQILVFQRHGHACCVRSATIRAHIKDCARVLSGYQAKDDNTRSFATRVINGLYHDPAEYWTPILRPDSSPVTKHDRERDLFVHPRHGISALKRIEIINPARIVFTLLMLQAAGGKNSIAEDDLHRLFQYGGVHGYGGERGNGEGRYTYSFERVEDGGAADSQHRGPAPQVRATTRRGRA